MLTLFCLPLLSCHDVCSGVMIRSRAMLTLSCLPLLSGPDVCVCMCVCSGVMISTDVMSRGVDVPDVDWVVQFDPPSAAQ